MGWPIAPGETTFRSVPRLAEAADASVNEEPVRGTWVEEARLMVELILGRTDE